MTKILLSFRNYLFFILGALVKPVKNRQTLRYDDSSLTSDLKAEAIWVRLMVLTTNRA